MLRLLFYIILLIVGVGWMNVVKKLKKNVEIFIGDIRDPQSVKTAVSGCESFTSSITNWHPIFILFS